MSERARLRHYEIEREIARGGMAIVYLALDTRSNHWVALKQMLPGIFHDPEFAARFRREVRIHASLAHPNILQVHDFEAGPEVYYIAMELVDGGTLRTLCDRVPVFPVEASLHVVGEVLRGLAHAHASGIVHRDVKPQNVLISRAGDVKVADFGISKTEEMTRLTLTGNLVGTPSYMSPEQAALQPVDARADIFSTGVMLYELLSGHNPFSTSNPVASLKLIAEHTPPPLCQIDPCLPIACELLAERMLAKRPDGRFPTAQAAVDAIESVLATLEVEDPAAAFRRFLQSPARYLQQRNAELAAFHRSRAEQLAASGAASEELVLWETFLAHRLDPSHEPTAGRLAAEVERTGYQLEPAQPTPRVLEVERQLRADPDNPRLLLQLAKLHKVNHSFLPFMRCFFRLRSMDLSDRYLAGQLATLVARSDQMGPAPPRPAGLEVVRPSPAEQAQAPTLANQTIATPPPAPAAQARPPAPRPAPAPARARPTPRVPPVHPTPPAARRISLPYLLAFAASGALVLAGVVKLILAMR